MIDFLRIAFSILLPPVAVFTKVGLELQFWLNLLLTTIGYVPGVIHAVWIVGRK